ncbi:hypothetical protein [Nitratidesulfovibrio sp. 1201_IL3209]|uniref:hypothetical protein n=1 Tax=Nitratidesulfovibrio sp. 1201_IL3209 TaxID=3084053 RepID=UPI002FD97113
MAEHTQSRFGWPQNKRAEEIKRAHENPARSGSERVTFQGQNLDIPIVRVPIDLPKYRLTNGRTVSLQAQHLAERPDVRPDLFSGDPELWDAQEAQHNLLLSVVKVQGLLEYFTDTAHQQVNPILLDEHGFVVNGNRRLACWRHLLHSDTTKYGHFRHIDVAVLPPCDEREIDRIEAKIQVKKDIRADYTWDAKANMLIEKQKRDGFNEAELAELYEMTEGEVRELLDMRAYADEYLRSRGQQNMWSNVSNHEYAFQKIVALRQKMNGVGDKELFKEAAFTLIDKPEEGGGRLYDQIPAIAASMDAIKEKLQEEIPVEVPEAVPDLDEMFGDGGGGDAAPAPQGEAITVPLAVALKKPENSDKARKIIVEIIESQKQLKRDAKNANFLLTCCSRAHSQLEAAVSEGLRPESKRNGVARQLDAIMKLVGRIQEYLDAHAAD